MGRDKAVVVIGGIPLWERQLRTLRACGPAEVLISGRRESPYAEAGIEVVPDSKPGLGPLAGIAALLRRVRTQFLLVLAIDLPEMTSEYLQDLVQNAAETERGIVPRSEHRFEPLAAVYSRNCLHLAEEQLACADRRLQQFVRRGIASQLMMPKRVEAQEASLFRNVNTPHDLRGAGG